MPAEDVRHKSLRVRKQFADWIYSDIRLHVQYVINIQGRPYADAQDRPLQENKRLGASATYLIRIREASKSYLNDHGRGLHSLDRT